MGHRYGGISSVDHKRTRAEDPSDRFDDSACVLLNSKSEMLGTRITGPVSLSLKDRVMSAVPGGRWGKVLALAPKVSPHCLMSRILWLTIVGRSFSIVYLPSI